MRVSNMSLVRQNFRVCRVNWRMYIHNGKLKLPNTQTPNDLMDRFGDACGIMDEIYRIANGE